MGDPWEPDSTQGSALGAGTTALTLRTGRTPPVSLAWRSWQCHCLAGTRWGGWGGHHGSGEGWGS